MHTGPFKREGLTLASLLLASLIIGFQHNASASTSPKADDSWGDSYEPDGHKIYCPENEVLIGRKHLGDEDTGKVWVQCDKYKPYGIEATLKAAKTENNESGGETGYDPGGDWYWVNEGKPNGHDFICPDDQVMSGIAHTGDENEPTGYRCSTVMFNGEVSKMRPGTQTYRKESNHSFICMPGQALVRRAHLCEGDGSSCDENQNTIYQCGYVRAVNAVESK